MLAVLEDAGEPAHVRNDFRRAYLGARRRRARSIAARRSSGSSPKTYGRMGVPAAVHARSRRPTVMAFITAADGQGLADRTQRRFFSDGSLPDDAVVDRGTTAAEVMLDARGSLPYAYPRLPRLELKVMGKPSTTPARRTSAGLLAYERVPGRVRFFLDEAVYADTARALLPEIAGYGAGLIDHLFRAEIRIESRAATRWCRSSGRAGSIRKGEIRVFAEDAAGRAQAAGDRAAGLGGRRASACRRGRRSWAPSCAARTTPATSSPWAKPPVK